MSTLKDEDSPKQQINEQSLTQDLEKNRESLKRKLQTRRSLKQLVDVGIMPPPKAPLPFYEQRKQLQMRKTQDILKNKIISRPDRQLLIEHNILSDTTAAPAIQKTQCQLKRARLADNLNDKLAARPGILELVASNILEIDPNLKEAIQHGRIKFPTTKSPSKVTIDQQPRPLRPKTSSFSNTINGQSFPTTTITTKRSLASTSKIKSSLTFHEYKGPSQKVEITKVPLQPTPSLIVQPVQATLLPLVPLEQHNKLNENHYRIQLRQQQLFLELLHNNKTIENDDKIDDDNNNNNNNNHKDTNNDDNPIGNLLQQPIDDNVNLLTTISDEIQTFEKMKLVDLKNECRRLNLSTTGTKMKLIEKLRNAKINMSDTTIIPSQTINNETSSTQMTSPTTSSVTFLIPTPSLSDQELYQQQQQKIIELENQLQKLKQLDSFSLQTSHLIQHVDNSTTIPPKCNPIVSVELQKRVLLHQQEKLKQKIHDEQQQQQQQHSIVPLTPESVAQFLANQTQPQTSDNHPWSIHHSMSAPTFPTFMDSNYYDTCHVTNNETKLVDDDAILSLLDDFPDSCSTLPLHPDDSLTNPSNSYVSSSPNTHMDWLPMITSPTIVNDLYDDNNSDLTQFLNQFGNDHHHLFDTSLSSCQQQNVLSFDLLSPSSPMI
ncbi:unnamed protein product [Rotaria sp. Silwood2]|nr:unnamed protein product [Rotaria sp. Silwood2]CAF2586152.1 unnamed protein product [Rotaria sp. Silwood2]CAF4160867.1 unnamed protein product [Rotaria sp. Silwood2]